MFGFFRKRLLDEHKKLIWQNLHGSKDLIEALKGQLDIIKKYNPNQSSVFENHIKKCEEINSIATNIFNKWNMKDALDGSDLDFSIQGNRILRLIYDESTKKSDFSHRSFDEFVNPPYGWDKALESWK